MNQERLFEFLGTQSQTKLLDLLDAAYTSMDTDQRCDVFGQIDAEVPPYSVDGEQVLADIEVFHRLSLAGHYYAPFSINSKNFTHVPEETSDWFNEVGDYLEDSAKLTDQGEDEIAVKCFKLLHELIDAMGKGDEIVFADEYGTWMIGGDEKRFITSYLSSLAATSTPEAYAEGAIPVIQQDSYESFHNKVYALAIEAANAKQKACLEVEVKKQKVRTQPRQFVRD